MQFSSSVSRSAPVKRTVIAEVVVLILSGMFALDAAAQSQVPVQSVPTPGAVLESTRAAESPIPPPKKESGLVLPRSADGQQLDPNAPRTLVKAFRIVGNKEIDAATLHRLVDAEAGKPLNLFELHRITRLVTDFYRKQGFPVARAVIPAQRVEDGNVTIEVIEGRIDRTTFTGNELYSEPFLQRWSAPLLGQAVRVEPLEERVLTLNDLPGLTTRAVLIPGLGYGTTTTEFLVSEKAYDGEVSVNNYGRPEIGRTRVDASANLNNPFGIGDQLGVRTSVSEHGLLKLGGLNYSLPLNVQGTRLALSYTHINYGISGELARLDIKGKSQLASATVIHPFLRSAQENLYGTFAVRSFAGEQSALDVELSKSRVSVFEAGTAWNHIDDDFNVATAGLRVSSNFNGYKEDHSNVGQKFKIDGEVSYLYNLTPAWNVKLAGAAQWTPDTLADAEKFSLGGPTSVRGYPSADVRGDRGAFASVELRYRTTLFGAPGWFGVFADGGRVSRVEAVEGQPKSNAIGSAGIGATFFPTKGTQLEVLAAKPTSSLDPSDMRKNGRVWVNLTTRF
ncbi:ShlB/FhaC/HecB family hemolysin secretion/activation protein [Telluria sp. B2]